MDNNYSENKLEDCELLYSWISTEDPKDTSDRTYLENLIDDTNDNVAYLIKAELDLESPGCVYCVEYSFNNSDFIVIPELNKDGIEFCIDTNNTILFLGKSIDIAEVKDNVTYYLKSLYNESMEKIGHNIHLDSIDPCLEIYCNKTFINQDSFDWDNYRLVLHEVFQAIDEFRNTILCDAFESNSSSASELQVETINNYFIPYIYVAFYGIDCYYYEKPHMK